MEHSSGYGRTALAVMGIAAALVGACGDGGGSAAPAPQGAAAGQSPSPPPAELGTHQPYASLGMNTGERDPAGRPVRIACTVCHHDAVKADPANADQKQLKEFHRGVVLDHGTHATCLACHTPPNYETFRLASGKTVTYGNVVELCAQCHSEQWRDYQYGAHGGMTGYWDKSRGERDRNHCLDCHNPHTPGAKQLVPAKRPNVRFQRTKEPGHG